MPERRSTDTELMATEAPHGRLRSMPRLRVAGGFVLLVAGLICAIPGVPFPGIAMVVIALLILSDHFTWAKTALDWVRTKSRAAGLPEWAVPDPSARSKDQRKRSNGAERASQTLGGGLNGTRESRPGPGGAASL